MLVPRPRINLPMYYGVLAPHAACRAAVVPRAACEVGPPDGCAAPDATAAASPGPTGDRWADLMRRVLDVDVLACPRCGGPLRLLALQEAGTVTARILRHLGLPSEVPPARPARAPPLPNDDASLGAAVVVPDRVAVLRPDPAVGPDRITPLPFTTPRLC